MDSTNHHEEESCLTRHGNLVHCTHCHCRNHSEIIMSGFLIKSPPLKKSFIKKKWHKRYFILRADKTLEYYFNSKKDEPIAVINLQEVDRIEVGLRSDMFGNMFNIVTPKRTYFFSAGSSHIMWLWVDHIKDLIEQADVTVYETENPNTDEPHEKLMHYYVNSSHVRLRKKNRMVSTVFSL
eukprot:TRINITY_DN1257_c0_g1_i2.p1 TRINITY_DN1257_c0_g1~~TRINITY_DN1257_c0_g1_i2.p1  ORF type:complete len:181 (-),score=31.02 TRINITY_DN1257_c0_g1_i2:14-556(-)